MMLGEQVLARYNALAKREQQLFVLMVIIFVAIVAFTGIVEPLSERRRAAEYALASEETLFSWLEDKAPLMHRSSSSSVAVDREMPSLANIQAHLKAQGRGLAVYRLERVDGIFHLYMRGISFTQAMEWATTYTDAYRAEIVKADIQPGQGGKGVDVLFGISAVN